MTYACAHVQSHEVILCKPYKPVTRYMYMHLSRKFSSLARPDPYTCGRGSGDLQYAELFCWNAIIGHFTVNNSFCAISSLEVYRRREQAIEINHEGFSLNDDGSIEVDDKYTVVTII